MEQLFDLEINRYKNFLRIITAAETAFDVAPDALFSRDRCRQTVDRRRAVIHMLRLAGYTLAEIGLIFSRHHATVMYSERTHESLYRYDEHYRTIFNKLVAAIETVDAAKISESCLNKNIRRQHHGKRTKNHCH